jgi:hypothetical protein
MGKVALNVKILEETQPYYTSCIFGGLQRDPDKKIGKTVIAKQFSSL